MANENEKNVFGNRITSNRAAIMQLLQQEKQGLSMKQILDKLGLQETYYNFINSQIAKGYVTKSNGLYFVTEKNVAAAAENVKNAAAVNFVKRPKTAADIATETAIARIKCNAETAALQKLIAENAEMQKLIAEKNAAAVDRDTAETAAENAAAVLAAAENVAAEKNAAVTAAIENIKAENNIILAAAVAAAVDKVINAAAENVTAENAAAETK